MHKYLFIGMTVFAVSTAAYLKSWQDKTETIFMLLMVFGMILTLIGFWESRADPQKSTEHAEHAELDPSQESLFHDWLEKDPSSKYLNYRQQLKAFRRAQNKV